MVGWWLSGPIALPPGYLFQRPGQLWECTDRLPDLIESYVRKPSCLPQQLFRQCFGTALHDQNFTLIGLHKLGYCDAPEGLCGVRVP